MLYFIFHFILALIDVWLINFYLSKNYIISNKKSNILIQILTVITIFISHLFLENNFIISAITMSLALIILPKKYQLLKKDFIKYFAVFFILTIVISNLINIILNWVFDTQLSAFYIDWSLTYVILIEAVIRYVQLLIIIYITNKNTKKNITLHNFKGFSFFLSFYFAIVLIINNDKLFIFRNVGRTFILVILVYNIALIFFDRFQTHHEQLEYDHKQLKNDSSSESLYFKEHVVGNDQIRSIKHDMKNHMSILSGFIESDKKESALEYIRTIHGEIDSASFTLHSGITPLDSVITSKVKTMNNLGIKYTEKFKLICLGVVYDSDLALMLASALDNAIEAANKSEDKIVSLEIGTELNYLCITLVNSIKKGSKPNFRKTTKEDKTKHGFGYKKIKSIVKKYNGDLYTEVTHDKVIMTITLRID